MHRLDWHRQLVNAVALGELQHVDVSVGVYISGHINNETGVTFLSHQQIAHGIGATQRTAQSSTSRMRDHGDLVVKPGGGRKVANEYSLNLKNTKPASQIESDTTKPASEFQAETTKSSVGNYEADFRPTLLNTQVRDARARTREGARASAPAPKPGFMYVDPESLEASAYGIALRRHGRNGTLQKITLADRSKVVQVPITLPSSLAN
jgi:hypothetical protein